MFLRFKSNTPRRINGRVYDDRHRRSRSLKRELRDARNWNLCSKATELFASS